MNLELCLAEIVPSHITWTAGCFLSKTVSVFAFGDCPNIVGAFGQKIFTTCVHVAILFAEFVETINGTQIAVGYIELQR